MNGVCVINVCKHFVRFFKKRKQNLNTPQDNSASRDWQMGFNWACKGLKAKTQRLIQRLQWLPYHQNSGVWTYNSVVSLKLWMLMDSGMNTSQRCAVKHGEDSNWFSRWRLNECKMLCVSSSKSIPTVAGQTLKGQEVEAARISRHSAHKGDKVVSPMHRPPLHP